MMGRARLGLVVAIWLGAWGCRQIAGIDEPRLVEGGEGSGGAAGQTGGGGTSGASGGQGGVAGSGGANGGGGQGGTAMCATVGDCVVEVPECRSAVGCTSGICVYQDAPEGTPLPTQAPGDCSEVVCDGQGKTKVVPAPADSSDDQKPCTVDTCEGTTPVHTLLSGLPCYTGVAGTEGIGACKGGMRACDANGDLIGPCVGEVTPALEVCDGSLADEDCDGAVNEGGTGCVCVPGAVEPCYSGAAGTLNVGVCQSGMHTCEADGQGFGPCAGEKVPGAEQCDAAGLDEDCDGKSNEEGAGCVCGDGFISNDEVCDDGNGDDTDVCPNDCKPRVLQVVGGYDHTCVLVSGGIVKCWGNANAHYGQLGQGNGIALGCNAQTMGAGLPSVDLGAGKKAMKLAAGFYHTCALLADGSVKCWGRNSTGQLGLGDTNDRGDQPNEMGDALPAVDLGAGKTATDIACGYAHTCAILNDGSLKCWGENLGAKLGLEDMANRGDGPGEMGDALLIVKVGTGKSVIAVAPGGGHTCAILNDGIVKCWGTASILGLGLSSNFVGDQAGEMGDNLPVVQLGAGKLASAISAGFGHTCAILSDGFVKCWGSNNAGQLGLGDTNTRGDQLSEVGDALPVVDLGAGQTVVSIAAGADRTCAKLSSGQAKCWGDNSYGRLGLGDTAARGDNPVEMGDALPAVNLGTGMLAKVLGPGYLHTCMVLENHRVKCWGNNGYCQAGWPGGSVIMTMGDALAFRNLFTDNW